MLQRLENEKGSSTKSRFPNFYFLMELQKFEFQILKKLFKEKCRIDTLIYTNVVQNSLFYALKKLQPRRK
jgi:hypothetical protein